MLPETLKKSYASTKIEFMWWGKLFSIPYFSIQDDFLLL